MIQVHEISKYYDDKKRGQIKAVDRVSFACSPGQIYGLLGPNGAGKTTTLRLLSTVLEPNSGSATVAGFDIVNQPGKVRASIGFLSGDTGLYRRLTGREILRYFGSLYGLDKVRLESRIQELSGILEMDSFLDSKTDKLSTGQKQRISIARTVVHDPPVLILDEPTSGLDIIASRAIMEFILKARSTGKTILFSTHVMREAERLCDHIGIIHQGRMWAQGTQDDLKKHYKCDDLEGVFVAAVNLEPLPSLRI